VTDGVAGLSRLRHGARVAGVAGAKAAGSRLGQGLPLSLSVPGAPLPVQCRMPVSPAAGEALGELVSLAAALAAASGGNLLECFAAVPDPRDPRGIRHSLPSVLTLCTAAVLCGNTSIEDVTAWVHHAALDVLAAAGARRNALGMYVAPHRSRGQERWPSSGTPQGLHQRGQLAGRRRHARPPPRP